MRAFSKRMRWMGRVLWRSTQVEAEMRDEMRFHIEMETERLRTGGLDAGEARRQAHVRFGGVEKYKEEGRDVRGRSIASSSPTWCSATRPWSGSGRMR